MLPLCLRTCDPLLQDCAEGEACVVIVDDFVCGPDASGPAGVFGDPCDDEPVQLPTLCDPGFACVDHSAVPGCAADGCCTAFCDLALGHEQCQGFADGQQCLTAVPLGEQAKDGVGLCLIPA